MLTDNIEIDTSWCTTKDTKGCLTNAILMAKLILHDLHVAKDHAGNLYYYDKGVYKPSGEVAIAEMYGRMLRIFDDEPQWSSRLKNEMIHWIGDNAEYILDRPDLDRINLKNGIYNWAKQEFYPSDPRYRTMVQIPIVYDPSARCPYWDTLLYELFPESGGPHLLKEVIALCMIPFMRLQKCIVLVGTGANGKSAFLNGLQAAIGWENCCSVSLHKLTANNERFYTAGLVGKLVNIFGDLSVKAIEDTASFKALTGEDRVTVEYKGKQPFSYLPFTRLIFSCNQLVQSGDDASEGYKRRFVNIPFQQVFSVDPKKGEEIQHNLSQPSELSGLFNSLIPIFPTIVEDGFTITEELSSVIENYAPVPEKERAWLKTHIIEDANGHIPSTAFYTYFVTHAQITESISHAKVVTYVRNTFPGIKANSSVRVWPGEPPIKCYKGIRLVDSKVQSQVLEDALKMRQESAITLNDILMPTVSRLV